MKKARVFFNGRDNGSCFIITVTFLNRDMYIY